MRIAFNTFKTYNNNPYQVNQQQKNNQTPTFKRYTGDDEDVWANEAHKNTDLSDYIHNTLFETGLLHEGQGDTKKCLEGLKLMIFGEEKPFVPENYFTEEEYKKAQDSWYEE